MRRTLWTFCFIGALTLSLRTTAQSWLWVEEGNSAVNTNATDVIVDGSGNSYAIGEFSDPITFGTTTLTTPGKSGYIVKYDPTGAVVWTAQIDCASSGGGGNPPPPPPGPQPKFTCTGIAIDASGDLFVSGSFEQTITSGTQTVMTPFPTISSMYIAKFNPSGVCQGFTISGGAGFVMSNVRVVVSPASDHVFVGGNVSNAGETFGATTLTPAGIQGTFTACYNNNGSATMPNLWAKMADGASSNVQFEDIAADNAGDVIISGYQTGGITFGSYSSTNAGGQDLFVGKYLGSNGNELWLYNVNSPTDEVAEGLGVDEDDNIYVVGGFTGPTTFDLTPVPNAGGADAFLVKLDPTGTQLNVANYGGGGNDLLYDVKAIGVDDVVAAGTFTTNFNIGVYTLASNGGTDTWVARLQAGGAPFWAATAMSSQSMRQAQLAVYGTEAYLTGRFNAQAQFGPNTATGSSTWESYTAKMDLTQAPYIAIVNAIEPSCPGAYDGSISLTVVQGSPPYTYAWSNGASTAAVGLLPVGTYTVTVTDNAGTTTTATYGLTAGGPAFWPLSSDKTGSSIGSRDMGEDIGRDALGNVYVAGVYGGSTSIGGVALNNGSSTLWSMYIAKFSACGDLLWISYGGNSSGSLIDAKGLAVDEANGYVYVTGALNGSTTVIPGNTTTPYSLTPGADQMYILKYDMNTGAIVQNYTSFSLTNAVPESMDIDEASGDLYVCGNSGSLSDEVFALRYLPAGTGAVATGWPLTSTFGTLYDRANDIEYANGGVYITGHFQNNMVMAGLGMSTSAPSGDAFVYRFTPGATGVWAVQANGINKTQGQGIAWSNNQVYVTGSYLTGLMNPFNGAMIAGWGIPNVFVFALNDATGAMVWYDEMNPVSTATNAAGWDVDADDNNVWVTGEYTGPQAIFNTGMPVSNGGNPGNANVFVSHYDPGGSYLGGTVMISDIPDPNPGRIAAGDDYTYTTGNFPQTLALMPSQVLSNATANTEAIYMARMETNTTVFAKGNVAEVDAEALIEEAVQAGQPSMEIYPNPGNGNFQVITQGWEGSAALEVLDITGRRVFEQAVSNLGATTEMVDLSSLPTGSYIVRLVQEETVATQILIISE